MKTQEKHGGAQGSNLRDPARVIALSDGVFAIVLTLLVLGLEVPELGPGQSLGSAVVGLGPKFVAYVISFLMTGMYWVWHRDLFAGVRHVDRAVAGRLQVQIVGDRRTAGKNYIMYNIYLVRA